MSPRRILPFLAGAALAAVFIPAPAQSDGGAPVPEIVRVGKPASASVPVAVGSAPRTFVPVVRMTLTLRAGDTVSVVAAGQVTTETPYMVMLCDFLKVSTTASAELREGTLIERPMAVNFNRPIHHQSFGANGAYVAPRDETVTFTLVAYSASSAATKGTTLKVDYGSMTALIFRASAA
jgi:hypothetical protein